MEDLTFVTICMGRLDHLKQTLPFAVQQRNSKCIVVDYSCPQRCGDWVEANFPTVRVVRVLNRQRFSPAEARNAGAKIVDTDWICFFDADVVLDPTFAEQVRAFLSPHTYYIAKPIRKELWGTSVCLRHDFERVGGFDEVIRNYGQEDHELYRRLQLFGVKRGSFPAELVRPITHPDSLRVENFEEKALAVSDAVNLLYINLVHDALRMRGAEVSLEERRGLYEAANEAVRKAYLNQDSPEIHLSLRDHELLDGSRIKVWAHYSFEAPNARPDSMSAR